MEGRGLMKNGYLFWVMNLMVIMGSAKGAQIQVGGTAGWTLPVIANVNYTTWSASQIFVVGDTLYFNYSKEYHNVMVVTKTDYEGCKANNPISTYDDGETSITLDRSGTFYFLCGVPSHCTAGQKVEVKVRKHALFASSPSSSTSSQQSISPSTLIGPIPTSSPPGIGINESSITSSLFSSIGFLTLASSLLLYAPLFIS